MEVRKNDLLRTHPFHLVHICLHCALPFLLLLLLLLEDICPPNPMNNKSLK